MSRRRVRPFLGSLGLPPILFACSLGALLLAPGAARAQRGIDAQTFRPSLDSYGIFTVERADVSHQWDFGFKLYTSYAGTSLRLNLQDPSNPTTNQTQALLDHLASVNLQLHLGLTNWLELALDFPIAAVGYTSAYGSPPDASVFPTGGVVGRTGFYEGRGITTIPPPDAAPLDARLALKAKLFRRGLFGMAFAAVVTVPFGDDAAFLGDSNFTFRPNVIADFTRGPITVAVNLGAILRETTAVYDPHEVALRIPAPRLLLEVGHELTYGAGIAYRFVHWVGLGAEVYGLVPLVGRTKDYTADVLGGLQFFPTRDLVVSIGAGAGIIQGAARRDDYRAFLGISWAPAADGRGSGSAGGLDSDSDGVPDSQDLCPNEPEDKDGFDDEDGCPDLDNDHDGIPDRSDKCPDEPEDKDGFQDHDGCPETDNDGDGIPDAQDKCPNDPEDRDGFQDDDGCPDADNDGDGIPDVADRCPNEPETRNGVNDDDGCPDSGGQVMIAAGKIDLPGQIQFDANQSSLTRKMEETLVSVAEKLKLNPNVKRVRIEGHADRSEPARRTQALSQARANAVRELLLKRGVDGVRLQAVGYGAARPIDKRTTPDARARNRRVELIIVEQ